MSMPTGLQLRDIAWASRVIVKLVKGVCGGSSS